MPVTVQRVVECLREAEQTAEKLVLIVGQPGSGKSKIMRELSMMRGWKYVDCRELITDDILEMIPKVRAQEAPHIISKILASYNAEVILLDDIQILFIPVLKLEPVELLRQLSRKFSLVVAWPGEFEAGKLISAAGGPGGLKEYPADDLKVIQIG